MMKKENIRIRPDHSRDRRWNHPAIATAIAFLCMLPTAHSDSEFKEQEEGSPGVPTRRVSYILGYKHLSSQWGQARNQIAPGIVDFDIRPHSWPVSIVTRLAFGYSGALPIGADPSASFSGSWDIDAGLRHEWTRFDAIQPFIGGGVALVGGSTTVQIRTHPGAFYYQNWSQTTASPFLEAGFYLPLRNNWHTGVLVSYTGGKGQINGNGIELGCTQVAFLIGKSWGWKHRSPSGVL